MKNLSVADYFIEVFIANGITDVFGYQGGMIAYIFDSLGKYKNHIAYHSCGTEQGAAIAAASYAQASGKFGVAISTSGPGFTNMITGIANAWFDSLPVIYISGNVNTKDKTRDNTFRQNGFQEIQATKMAAPITKRTVEFELGMDYVKEINNAIRVAMTDRKGPVYIDLPINVCRERVEIDTIDPVVVEIKRNDISTDYFDRFLSAEKPVIIAGAGIKQSGCRDEFRKLMSKLKVPVVTTMPAIDVLESNSPYWMGYIGGTARREAGIVLQNADAILTIGTRLCSKQIGHNMELFAPKANLFIRTDIDPSEFERQLKKNEEDIVINLSSFIPKFISYLDKTGIGNRHVEWLEKCNEIKKLLKEVDITYGNMIFKHISNLLPENSNIVFDVGKNLNYGTQSLIVKKITEVYMSAGLGTMGYAIPGAIGAVYGNHRPTFAFTGDGGAQMNIQELNTIVKNNLPIKIFVLNNRALGNIKIFQENYLNSHFVATTESEGDYFSCNFVDIAKGYGMRAFRLDGYEDIGKFTNEIMDGKSVLFEINYEDCPALPGIVAGGEYLKEGKGLDKGLIDKIVKIFS